MTAARLPTLKSADHAERVIYVGTFSKSMFPSLRLGFYLAPRPLGTGFPARFGRLHLRRAGQHPGGAPLPSSTRGISPPICAA